ncbi:hypothetical protein ACFQS7_18660 [Dankookia sp. GCM10030260]|uniref:hypothetical protein n=1 Tax=Dankookia sp. GCM10030260 TaxID=3273390 RepID=UPI003615D85B
MRIAALLVILGPSLALGACAVRREASPPPPAYSQASPYAPGIYVPGPHAAASQAMVPVPGSSCAEAVAEAQDAAARAQASGRPGDAGRADRSAQHAARDCR